MDHTEFEKILNRDVAVFCDMYDCQVHVDKLAEPWEDLDGHRMQAYEVTLERSKKADKFVFGKFRELLSTLPYCIVDNDGHNSQYSFTWTIVNSSGEVNT